MILFRRAFLGYSSLVSGSFSPSNNKLVPLTSLVVPVDHSNISGTNSITSMTAELQSTKQTMTPESLIGRTFTYEYGSVENKNYDTYQFKLVSKDQIEWTRTASSNYEVGKKDVETYTATAVPPNSVLISWVEADKLSLTNLMNFDTMQVLTHASQDRSVFQHTAKLTLL